MDNQKRAEANRRNARKSTGPRSSAGKKRASGNSYRHGLSLTLRPNDVAAKKLEKLARKIAGGIKSEVILQHARDAAYAEFELARIQKVKVALIELVSAFGSIEAPRPLGFATQQFRSLLLMSEGKALFPAPVDPSTD